jgi:hypothetical protein
MDLQKTKKQKRLDQWRINKYTNKLCTILPKLCDDVINVILLFLGMNIVQLKNIYKLQFYKNLTYMVTGACKKIKMKLIYFVKLLSVYEMVLFGKFCLQYKVLENYRSYTYYAGDYSKMTISILIEKHTEMKQKQMKCSDFYSCVNACQRQIVKYLYNDDFELTKKEACIIQKYINKR